MEIGYSSEESEKKAIAAMGNAEEISTSLSKLYNSFYNPMPDIIAYCIWFGMLGILYLAFKKYIFNNLGTTAICACGIAFSSMLLCLYSAITALKKRKQLIIGQYHRLFY